MKKDKKRKKAKKSTRETVVAVKEPSHSEPKVHALVREIIERVADKWTMVVLDVLAEHGVVRFTKLGQLAGGVSQKMLTKTVRQMESDGLVKRTVHPVVPPRVEYELTELGHSLGEAFCGVWLWAEKNYDAVERARTEFRGKPKL
jgi:DNA-binding HxlR family transcriptional regulator